MRKLIFVLCSLFIVASYGQRTTMFDQIGFLSGGSLYKILQATDSIQFNGINYSSAFRRKVVNSVSLVVPKYENDRISYPGIKQYTVHLPVTKPSLLMYNPIDKIIYGQDESGGGSGIGTIEQIDVANITSHNGSGVVIPTVIKMLTIDSALVDPAPATLATLTLTGIVKKKAINSMLFGDSAWVRSPTRNTTYLRNSGDSLALPGFNYFPSQNAQMYARRAGRTNTNSGISLNGFVGSTFLYASHAVDASNVVDYSSNFSLNLGGAGISCNVGTENGSFQFTKEGIIMTTNSTNSGAQALGSAANYWKGLYAKTNIFLGDLSVENSPAYVLVMPPGAEPVGAQVKKIPYTTFSLAGHTHSYEPLLGNPATNGQALVSLTNGSRFWSTLVPFASPTFTGVLTSPDVVISNNEKFTTFAPLDHSTSGSTISMTAGVNTIIGDVVYIGPAGTTLLCKADVIANCPYCLAICADVTVAASVAGSWLTKGTIRDDTWNWTTGGLIYVSTTGTMGNTLTQTAPSGSNNVIMPVGVALSADVMYFYGNVNSVEKL